MKTLSPILLLTSFMAIAPQAFAAPTALTAPDTEASLAETIADHWRASSHEDLKHPMHIKYTVAARVKLGANPCHADGVTAQLVTKVERGEITVTPFVTLPASAFERMCPATDEPVFAEISTDVEGDRHRTASITVRNVENFTATLPLEMILVPANQTALIVLQGTVDRTTLSQNNDTFSLMLKLRIQVPKDFCASEPEKLRIEQVMDQNTLRLRAVRTLASVRSGAASQELDCSQVFGGQAHFRFAVSGQLTRIEDVVMENVQEFGQNVSLAEYLKVVEE